MGPKRRIVLVVVLLGALVAVVPAAQGGRGSGPIASITCKRIAPGVCEESGDVTMPPDSFASQTTDTVPSKSKEEDTFLQPFNASELAEFDSLWESVADGFPKFAGIGNVAVRRVITCALFSRVAGNISVGFSGASMVTKQIRADNANAAVLAACIQVAVTGQQATGAARGAASANHCSTAVVSLPVQISRSGSRYTVQANSRVSRASGPLAVSCRVRGNGLAIKLRTRKRGRTLRSLVGPKFGIGYSNHTTKSAGVRATFRFS